MGAVIQLSENVGDKPTACVQIGRTMVLETQTALLTAAGIHCGRKMTTNPIVAYLRG